MFKLNYSQKKKLKKTLTVIGVILAVALVIGLIVSLVNKPKDDYEKINLTWTVGGITEESGKFDPEMKTAMTSQRIKYEENMKIVPDFHSGVAYAVAGYDENDRILLYMEIDSGISIFNPDYLPEGKVVPDYVRIVIFPNDEDGEINWFETFKYSNQIEAFRYVGETDTTEE